MVTPQGQCHYRGLREVPPMRVRLALTVPFSARRAAAAGFMALTLASCHRATAPAEERFDRLVVDSDVAALDDVGPRRALGPTTDAALQQLFVVEVVLAVDQLELTRLQGCAVLQERLVVTARRLVRPEEYDVTLAAQVAAHLARGRRLERRCRFTRVEGGEVLLWPAPPTLGKERGLDEGPDLRGALGALQEVEVEIDGQRELVRVSVRPGRHDLASFVVRGAPFLGAGAPPDEERLGSGELAVAIGAHQDEGGQRRVRAIGRVGPGPSLGLEGAVPNAGLLGAPVARLPRHPFGSTLIGLITDDRTEELAVAELAQAPGRALVAPAPAATVRGRLVDPDGEPLTGYLVRAYAAAIHSDNWLGSAPTVEAGWFAAPAAKATDTWLAVDDEDGSWLGTLRVPPGATDVVLRLFRLPAWAHDAPEPSAAPDEKAPPPWTGLMVRAFDAVRLETPESVRVTARHDGVTYDFTRVDDVFELRDAAPGSWDLVVDGGEGRRAPCSVSVVPGQIAVVSVTWEGLSTRLETSQGVPGPPLPETFGRAVPGGVPSWFTFGGDTYFSHTADEVEVARLDLRPTPRWFHDVQGPPARLDELSRSDRGASLEVRAVPGPPGELFLEVELRAGPDGLAREVEHRITNLLPLLVGLEADGVPVVVEPPDGPWGRFGGQQAMVDLVAPNESRSWSLRLRSASLDRVVPRPFPARLALALAFCELQHEVSGGWRTGGRCPEPVVDVGLVVRPPTLVGSRPVELVRGPTGWTPAR